WSLRGACCETFERAWLNRESAGTGWSKPLDEVLVCVRRVELHQFDPVFVASNGQGKFAGDKGFAGPWGPLENKLSAIQEEVRPGLEGSGRIQKEFCAELLKIADVYGSGDLF